VIVQELGRSGYAFMDGLFIGLPCLVIENKFADLVIMRVRSANPVGSLVSPEKLF
jgi:hypothetical protein